MYNETLPGSNPIYIKVIGDSDTFFIHTDEYELSGKIKQEIAELKNISIENIRLHYKNKRLIEDLYTNHDQEVNHMINLYVVFKYENSEWENIDSIVPNLYMDNIQSKTNNLNINYN